MNLFSRIEKVKPKSQPITTAMVQDAWGRVNKSSKGKGIDNMSISDFKENLADNLYKIWNRMSSGSYIPPAIKEVEILKPESNTTRKLGVSTVADRVAQNVVSSYLESNVDKTFEESSFAYRKKHDAQQALQQCKENCWHYAWGVDIDIKGFFDNIDWELLMEIVQEHTTEKWVLMYVERWLKAPVEKKDGIQYQRTKGTPQGGVISPVLGNMYLDKIFDKWFVKKFPELKFERYADDVVIHCYTQNQAKYILGELHKRMKGYKLELHQEKTKIVFCQQRNRKGIKYEITSFKFLGVQFRPLPCKNRDGKVFQGFSAVVPLSSTVKINKFIVEQKLQLRSKMDIYQLAELLNHRIQSWINYFKNWNIYTNCSYFFHKLNQRLVKWAMKRYKRLNTKKKSYGFIKQIQRQLPNLFVHWKYGFTIGK